MPVESLLRPEKNPEIVLAVVGAIGVDFESLITRMNLYLKNKFDYNKENAEQSVIRLSNLIWDNPFLENIQLSAEKPQENTDQYNRLLTCMQGGDELRRRATEEATEIAGKKICVYDILAGCAVAEIIKRQTKKVGEKDIRTPSPRKAHILWSLKRPEEVRTIRQIYGLGFYLIGVTTPLKLRKDYLMRDKKVPEDQIDNLMERDEEDPENEYGQDTRGTFELADFFFEYKNDNNIKELERFLDLVFGDQYRTPTLDEHSMFLAWAASMRSASLSRQVGAAITNSFGDVIAIGANDVPRFGGGQYWPGDEDQRDYKYKIDGSTRDSNDYQRYKFVQKIASICQEHVRVDDSSLKTALDKRSPIRNVTEYGRTVHAEMEALLACARTGVSPRAGTVYVTLFPCHNCARHLIAAGIKRIVYLEPYPKSQAIMLHSDSMALAEEAEKTTEDRDQDKVVVSPFIGVAARRYMDLFSMRLGWGYDLERKNETEDFAERGKTLPPKKEVRVKMLPDGYIDNEDNLVHEMVNVLSYKKGETP